ncbi:CDP-diacylglycerol--glycerol-3-phosphate 3-phosphatidyltransferase [Cadophora gregata]|uniref:CDP-diacylglycerol--glycerol-3-phosphate 3-phosphatidyltransferase n=1 Tax=Cadophora gregata TaxID=51156 RepID=UPI0026DCB7C4|nr:CDP-diacylglycerol--glycerol-3-phosphate 3-phosphatidyltransferase [Cadophora gregata]KAK0099914.1 CDP-diacylglycerol--glycerol-3-phosphate 3-phosphatidyltransferase [Cadophora gregata f. sp. sojae]KAK0116237.1 CDP-diacylglycerol--glycerol-3-phosphate 3-phosphatidyltransferase [Cadophora gregata]
MLGAFTNELDRIAPKFQIQGSQIQILRSPAEFYETLKAKILAAEERIFLSTLYIGKTEHELISTLQQALKAKPKLKLSILTDALRGTRESPNASCASLLAPLVSEFGTERVEIRMYHTPNLTGLRKKYIPKRINEGWGLQHMKLYGVDDEIIISGANLSSDYFTNRQDRYHVFSSKEITEFFSKIHNAVSNLSFLVTPDPQLPAGYTLEWPTSNLAPSPLEDPSKYISQASKVLTSLIQPTSSTTPSNQSLDSKHNTTVYPLSQFTQLLSPDTSTELPAITSILKTLSLPSSNTTSWTFTAGYFNPHPSLISLLLSTTSRNNTVITASPWANGFYGSKGVSGLLPAAYTLLSRRFLEAAQKAGRGSDITLKEWRNGTVGEKDGWTYHAKGLWVSLDGETVPSISVVGSSNYTKRSYGLDLEVGTVIVTSDDGLKGRLGEERDGLGRYAETIGMDDFVKVERRVGIRVRVAMWIVQLVGGAL